MSKQTEDFPMKIEVSFNKLIERYEGMLDSSNSMFRERASHVIQIAEKYPILRKGLKTKASVEKHREQIDLLFEDLFPAVLSTNEIKIATAPYQDLIFKSTDRFKSIIESSGQVDSLELLSFSKDLTYIMGCSIILQIYYGYKLDFRRPTYYDIPDADGVMRYYRVMYNGEFTEIEKTDKAVDITQDDVDELMDNFDNIELWREKFPLHSYIFKGFVIATMFDVTSDMSIANFKASLLRGNQSTEERDEDFNDIFQSIFGMNDLQVGFTNYNPEDETFERVVGNEYHSHILNSEDRVLSKEALCKVSYYTLFKKNEMYTVSNTPKFHKLYPDNVLYKKLHSQGVNSAIFVSLVHEGNMLGILELTSKQARALNTINANKLQDILPFLVESVKRKKQRAESEIELLIQSECTSVHPSVHWKFRKEATRVLSLLATGSQAVFKEVVFDDVYPLFGQIDIKGSSHARNVATQKDLVLQLKHIKKIIKRISALEQLPIYEQIEFRIEDFLESLKDEFKVDSERKILNFLRTDIIPLFKHLSAKSDALNSLISEYNELIDKSTGLVYVYRKNYDESVMATNKRLASLLDKKQEQAQLMYPHYFERFKTDGIEHNMYIGESITKHKSFHKIYLYNLRLWQLQVMCEMENSYYKMKADLPVKLDVASMILVFNSSLSLRFRMDEKRFDVDGTYNARYEVIKKRVDKANIKGTEERITQPGKITIIYSQKEDEKEYLKYIGFLQTKKYLDEDVELLKLENLQGVTGLKAIRVSVLYASPNTDNNKEYYTYDDLMEQITS